MTKTNVQILPNPSASTHFDTYLTAISAKYHASGYYSDFEADIATIMRIIRSQIEAGNVEELSHFLREEFEN